MYRSPPNTSEYKDSFYNLIGSNNNGNYRGISAHRETNKVNPVNNLDFVKKRRHYEIYNKFTDIPEDVRENPQFYVTQSHDNKFHIYDLGEIERKLQRAGLTSGKSQAAF